jgi:hypothetical protein
MEMTMPTTTRTPSDYYQAFLDESLSLMRLGTIAAEKYLEREFRLRPHEVLPRGEEIARVKNMVQFEAQHGVLTTTPASLTSALGVISTKVESVYGYFAESERTIARGEYIKRQGRRWDCRRFDIFRHEVSAQFRAAYVALARMQISFEAFCSLITFEYICPPDPCDDLFFGNPSPNDPTFFVRPTLAPAYPTADIFAEPGSARRWPFAQREAGDQQEMGQGYAAEATMTEESYQRTIDELKRELAMCQEELKSYKKDDEGRASPTKKSK